MVNIAMIEGGKEFQQVIANTQQYVVIKFFATWCGACKIMASHYSRIVNELNSETFIAYRIDVDNNKDLAKQHNIEMLPTFVVYKNGQIVYQQTGTVHDKLRKRLAELSGR